MVIFSDSLVFLGSNPVWLEIGLAPVISHSLAIAGTANVQAESCQYLALYDRAVVTASAWQVVSGSNYATINSSGLLTALSGASGSAVEIACNYAGLTATKNLNVTFVAGSSASTIAETETIVDPVTGQTTETTTTTTTTTDASGSVTTETVVNESVTNQDGTSSQSETVETTNPDGSQVSNTTTTNYDENGDVAGSSTNETNVNPDGSSTSSTINYNAEGDPTTAQNEMVDTTGNVDTQDIEYNENGDPVVTGYSIDTTNSGGEGKQIENGVNTEYYAFDVTRGFILDIAFSIDFANQPANQDENHHNILTMKRANPEPWYGFQLRQTGNNRYIILGTQFSSGSNTNTQISTVLSGSVAEYSFRITYNPLAQTDTFVCWDMLTDSEVFSSNGTFPDIPDLRYLKVTLGCALDPNGDPYRYSNINVQNFSITKLPPAIASPVISCNGKQVTITCEEVGASIYYRLNQAGNFTLYSAPLAISDDTLVEAYSKLDDQTSVTVIQNCIYTGLKKPTISCNGEVITITCVSTGATIYYKLDHAAEYIVYNAPIQMVADTFVETYSEFDGETSAVVSETCIYSPVHDYSEDYLTFRVLTGGTIAWQAFGSGYAKSIDYSINGGAWTSIVASATPTTFAVASDDVVRFRGSNSKYAGSKANYAGFEGGTATFNIEGNIMSLIYGDNFVGNNTMSGTYNFCSIFKKSNVVSAENLILPATTLTGHCYRAMFSLCPSLIKAPALPATTLATYCYWYMFEGCPITTAPDLLAATLPTYAYGYMFTNCNSLNRIRCLATDISATNCLQGWVGNVAASGTFIKDETNTSWTLNSINGIPKGWTVYSDGQEPEPATPDYDVWKYGGQSIEPPYSINAEDGHSSNYAKGSFNFTLDVLLP